MDLKRLLTEFPTLELSTLLTDEQAITLAKTLYAQISALQVSLKDLQAQKRELNAQFKLAKGDQQKLALLKAQSKSQSLAIKEKESELREHGLNLQALFEVHQHKEEIWPPERFSTITRNTSSNNISVIEATDADASRWNHYVNDHPQASAYHDYQWRSVIDLSFNHQSFYLVAESENKQVMGVLPLTWLNSKLFGSFSASVPYFNYGGVLADNSNIEQSLLRAALALSKKLGWEHIEYRTCKEGIDLPSVSHKASMILPLPDTEERLDKALGTKVRAQYRQSEQAQPATHFGGTELLDQFYEVFAQNMRDLGTPVYSKAFFRSILTTFPEQAKIIVITVDGSPAAVGFLLGYGEILEIPWASTLRKFNKYSINMWMYRQILGYAIDKKFIYFDFGRSSIDAGTYKFKKQWGAKPIQHYWYYQLADGKALPQLNPNNPKYKLAISVWQKLPVWVTKIIGPPLVKYLP